MKRIILSLMAGIMAIAAGAQGADQDILAADRNHLTVTVAYDASFPGKWGLAGGSFKMFKPGSGVSVGADYLVLLGSGFFFEPGARLYYDSYRYDNIKFGVGSPEEPARTLDAPVRKTGLRIPLTFGYKFDILKRGSLFVSTGPEPILGFTAKTKVDDDDAGILQDDMYDTTMRRCDVAWNIRAAVIVDRLRIDLTGALGLTDVIKTDASMHERRLSIGLGYVF